jgi:hypothetical protein
MAARLGKLDRGVFMILFDSWRRRNPVEIRRAHCCQSNSTAQATT